MAPDTRSRHPAKKPIPTSSASSSAANPIQPSPSTAHAESSTPSFSSSTSTSQSAPQSQSRPSQTTFTSSFDQLYAQLQHDITHDPFWMGNSAYRDHVEWARVDESNDIVVEKRNPSVVADLSCIAEVSSVKYWMYPGGYCTAAKVDGDEGTNNFKPVPFYRSRGSARLVQPRKPHLGQWWIDTVKNLAALRREGSKKTIKTDIFDDNYSHMIRIRHDWFRAKDVLEYDDIFFEEESHRTYDKDNISHETSPSSSPHPEKGKEKGKGKEVCTEPEAIENAAKKENDLSDAERDEYKNPFDDARFHLSTWTFCSDSEWASTNINKILENDELESVPLPAFDLKRDEPIHPNDCEAMLKGALVLLTFNVARQTIQQNSVNVYLDVVKITRLLPPGYEDKLTSTVAKRRDHGGGQRPTKKARPTHF